MFASLIKVTRSRANRQNDQLTDQSDLSKEHRIWPIVGVKMKHSRAGFTKSPGLIA
jgi:hypothetical protein